MKDARFIPIATEPGSAINYNAEVVGKMKYEDFAKSSLAGLLFPGEKGLPDGYKDKFLKAWHEDAVRILGESTPKQEPAAKTK